MFRVKGLIILGLYTEMHPMPTSITPFRTCRLLPAIMVSGLAMSSTPTAAELIQYDQSGILYSRSSSTTLFPDEAFSASIVIDTDTLTPESSSVWQSGDRYYYYDSYTANIISFVITIGNNKAKIAGSGGEFSLVSIEYNKRSTIRSSYDLSPSDGAIYTVNTLGFDPISAGLSGFLVETAAFNASITAADFPLGSIPTNITGSGYDLGLHSSTASIEGVSDPTAFGKLVPEPSSATVMGLGALALLRRKKKEMAK